MTLLHGRMSDGSGEEMKFLSEKIETVIDVDTFIERAERIVDKFHNNSTLSAKARREIRVLLWQFEEYLETRGLKG